MSLSDPVAGEIFGALMKEGRDVRRLESLLRERDAEIKALAWDVASFKHRVFALTAECSARAAATEHYRELLNAELNKK